VRSLTVIDTTARLAAGAALGSSEAYNLVYDASKDCICVEFRPGASGRSSQLISDSFDVNGERVLNLLFGPHQELEGIVIWQASKRLPPDLAPL